MGQVYLMLKQKLKAKMMSGELVGIHEDCICLLSVSVDYVATRCGELIAV